MNLNNEHIHKFILSAFLITVGCCLLIAGFVVKPNGEIHPSVLTAFGEILCFVGTLEGIDYHRSNNKKP